MSTHFYGEGNIGSAPEFREFPNGNNEPRRLLRLNVYFDNPVPTKEGFEDRGGFWAPVEIWHRDAERWAALYQKGMRVLVEGRAVKDDWEDADENERVTFKIEARRAGILPYRIESVVLGAKPAAAEPARTSDHSRPACPFPVERLRQPPVAHRATASVHGVPLRSTARGTWRSFRRTNLTASIRGLIASGYSCRRFSLATSVQIFRHMEHKFERFLAVDYLVHHLPPASRQRFGTALRRIPHGGIRTVDGRRQQQHQVCIGKCLRHHLTLVANRH